MQCLDCIMFRCSGDAVQHMSAEAKKTLEVENFDLEFQNPALEVENFDLECESPALEVENFDLECFCGFGWHAHSVFRFLYL